MIGIGNHVSMADGFRAMMDNEETLGGNTFAFFTRNPRGGKEKAYDEADVGELRKLLIRNAYYPLVAHLPYTMNLCSEKEDIRDYGRALFERDLSLMEKLPGNYLNFHPGSRLSQDPETAITQIATSLNSLITKDMKTTILLETMAGKGSEVGRTFEELRKILDKLDDTSHVGICLDTCHVWDGGYDIKDHLEDVLAHFDAVIGLERLKAIHLNDSKNPLGAHKDRHEKLGEGYLGLDAIQRIIQHPKLQNRPFILETPNDDLGYRKEIAWVRTKII